MNESEEVISSWWSLALKAIAALACKLHMITYVDNRLL